MASALEKSITASIIGALKNAEIIHISGPLDGVFGNTYLDTQGIANSGPSVVCNATEAQCVAVGDGLRVDDANYVIREKQPDAMGAIVLILEAA